MSLAYQDCGTQSGTAHRNQAATKNEPKNAAPRVLTREYYERIHTLDEHHGWYRGMREVTMRLVERFCERERPLRILDAGCGTGGLLSRLGIFAGPGSTVVGLDLSPEALQHCQQRGLGGLVQSSVWPLPFHDLSFDVITCCDVLQHVEGTGDLQALGEFYRVLRPSGVLVLRVAAGIGCPTYSHRYYQTHDVVERLKNSNFLIEKVSYLNQVSAWVQTLKRKNDPGFIVEGLPEAVSSGVTRFIQARWWKNKLIFYTLKWEARKLLQPGRTFKCGTSVICVARKRSSTHSLR